MLTMGHGLVGNSGNWSDSGKGSLEFDSGNFPARPKGDRLQFANYMFAIYSRIIAAQGLPSFIRARKPVTTNPSIKVWTQLAVTPQQCWVMGFLTFGFPARFKGPVPTSSTVNHASARAHPQDIAQYIIT